MPQTHLFSIPTPATTSTASSTKRCLPRFLPPDLPPDPKPTPYPFKTLDAIGVPVKAIAWFAAQGVVTLAELDDWLAADPTRQYQDAKGLGPVSADKVRAVHEVMRAEWLEMQR